MKSFLLSVLIGMITRAILFMQGDVKMDIEKVRNGTFTGTYVQSV
jgi:hypothetical protein